jgi:hypothetical protein
MKLHRFLFAALLVTGFAGPSHAALFSTLGQTDNGAVGFNSASDLLASDFLTGGTPSTITSITALMGNSSVATTLHVTFSIYADNGSGKPGTLVSAFPTASIPFGGGSGDVTATSDGINLQANTPYWVVGQAIDESVGGTVTWRFNSGEGTDDGSVFSTVTDTEIQYDQNGMLGGWVNSTPGNLMFALDGITTVPEPTGLALLVTAPIFGAFGWWRRRRVALDGLPNRGPAS